MLGRKSQATAGSPKWDPHQTRAVFESLSSGLHAEWPETILLVTSLETNEWLNDVLRPNSPEHFGARSLCSKVWVTGNSRKIAYLGVLGSCAVDVPVAKPFYFSFRVEGPGTLEAIDTFPKS